MYFLPSNAKVLAVLSLGVAALKAVDKDHKTLASPGRVHEVPPEVSG
jgi:hypothetical protein